MRQWTIALVIGALIATLTFPARAANPLKIGVAAPFTGALAKMGADIRNGVQFAIDEQNAKGGALGQQITLVFGDDKGDPREGILVANKLVQSGVLGVVGHLNSGISIPASKEVYAPAKVVMITPASTNPELTERGLANVFRTIGRDDQQGKDAAEYALSHGFKTAAVLHNKNAYGQGLAEVFRGHFEKGGGKILIFDGVMSGDKDFTPVLTRIKALQPALVFFGGEYQDGGLLVKQARRTGLRAPLMGGDGLYDHTFIALAGERAAEGSMVTFPGRGASGAWEKAYSKRFGLPGAYSGYSYDAARVLLDAIKRAGKADRLAVLSQVANTKSFPGVTGTITFNKKGDQPSFKFAVWRVHAGVFEVAR
ncbi:MAG: branched-chain amino acid ABC transporter substrate-binding protein [Cyanobacteria bacterium NC_groundwater_1444_Ag_S-0.65um_54_12]|nr:branched-chain amino acid ABC transporter substrate-binding protein [Cyanobacteria bacterium NC_groundwater_1444_Ag_S-0.65um_54_12]